SSSPRSRAGAASGTSTRKRPRSGRTPCDDRRRRRADPAVSYDSRFAEGHPVLRPSRVWSPEVIEDIQAKAQLGRYRIQGFSTHRRVTGFEDLTFVPCTLSRVPLEGYREKCETRTVLGTRFAENPVVLDRPITIAGMSYGALSRH